MQTFAKKRTQTRVSSNRAQSNPSLPGPNHDGLSVPRLQRAPGLDFSRLPLHPPAPRATQTKLALNEPGDTYEREADRVADQAITSPAHHGARSAPSHIQRFGGKTTGRADAVPASVNDALAKPGRPIELTLRRDMEERIGHDFSQVRVHSDAIAEQSARDLNASAYTLGHNIVFGAGGFKPETQEGRRLIAHELTHVVQQTGGRSHGVPTGHMNTIMRQPASPTPPTDQKDPLAGLPEWVLPILGDQSLTLTTVLRALAMGVGLIEVEPKSEDDIIKDSASKEAAEPDAGKHGLSSDEAGKQLKEQFIRNRAVDQANSLMGADWHAPRGSEAHKKAQRLHSGDPHGVRDKALTGGMLWAYENKDALQQIKEEGMKRYQKTKDRKALETAEAANDLEMALATSLNKPVSSQQHNLADTEAAENAWKHHLGSEKTKKDLEKVGFPLAWFTTCVTIVNPSAEAAGVDTRKWSPLDMFDKRRKERFKEAQESQAWVPAEKKEQPKPGDILIFVTYQKGPKGDIKKGIDKAFFQHVAILIEPVTQNSDGTERWVTADGGKGSSHKGEDKTGTTERRYNPSTLQFITGTQTNLQEAAEGGRYLLGFWSITRLPMRADTPAKKGAER
jgi:hypothetical protein